MIIGRGAVAKLLLDLYGIQVAELAAMYGKKFCLYLLAVNLLAFVMYGLDKKRAKEGAWRISEKRLLGVAIIGGSIGAILGMHIFYHKTRHWYFRYGLPVILLAQCLISGAVLYL